MSELHPPELSTTVGDGVHQSMCLPLHGRPDHNDVFARASSSSSPDSSRSLSSLSGGRTDSPADVPEGMMGRSETGGGDDDSGIQSPECKADENGNDNSVSVYLDADEEGWCGGGDAVTLVLTHVAHADGNGDCGRRGSEGSSATEAPLCSSEDEEGDDDDNDDEDSFLSLSSVDVVMRCQSEEGQMQSTVRKPEEGLVNELHQEALCEAIELNSLTGQMQSSEPGHEQDLVRELHQEAVCETMELNSLEGQMQISAQRPDEGPVSEHHQQALCEAIELNSLEGQMQISAQRPDEGPVSELHQETLQQLIELERVDEQILSSTPRSDEGPVSELYQETLQQLIELERVDEQILSSTPRSDEGPVSELYQETPQELKEPHTEEELLRGSNRRSDDFNDNELHSEDVQEVAKSLTNFTPSRPPGKVDTQTTMPSRDTNNTNLNNLKNCLDHLRAVCKPSTCKVAKVELKRFPRPDLRNVKAKVNSRAASAPRPATPPLGRAKPGKLEKLPPSRGRVANRREPGVDSSRKSRSSSNRVRANAPLEPSPNISSSLAEKKADLSPQMTPLRSKTEDDVREERGSAEVVPEEEFEDAEQNVSPSLGTSTTGTNRVNAGVCVGGRTVPAGVPKMRVTDGSAATCGPAPSCRLPQKPAPSKLPIKGAGLSVSLSASSLGSASSENATAAANNRGAATATKNEEKSVRPSSYSQGKAVASKPAAGHRNRANTVPAKTTAAGQRAPAQASQVTTKTTHNALQRGKAARPGRPSAPVERNPRTGRTQAGGTGRGQSATGAGGGNTLAEEEEERDLHLQNERKNLCILQLRKLVAHGNRRLEALALVIQHICSEREEALKQRKEVSLQLKNLREELASSVSCCERLEREKQDVCVALEAAVLKLQQQHQAELKQLEETLRDFYSAEWDKTHQAYQQQADRCRALMQQQVEEVKSKQEAQRKEQEVSHAEQMGRLKQEYETSLAELKKTHNNDMRELGNTMKQTEAVLNEKIESLAAENEALSVRLREEEEKRKALAEKSQKDSRVLYLEQELESVKVVLEMKTSQLHQQDKKLMQMDKLIESNVKLEECLRKLQQENEDYKARMDKHAALSRQLSTEQAVLQQSLQKESKVNKRLSMENEELLWKLHNGDLSSPRRLSPSSPFPSPRNSASFPSAPVSPR